MAKRGYNNNEYIPWSEVGASPPVASGAVDHSGNLANDPELLELAQMEAEERTRPVGHRKVYVGGYLTGNNGQPIPVWRGDRAEGLHGVGQPTVDGFFNGMAINKVDEAKRRAREVMAAAIMQIVSDKANNNTQSKGARR